MGIRLKLSYKIIWVFLMITMGIQAVEISNMSQAVNIAGKQRMFSYRMLKDYLMISMGSHYKNPKKDMEESITNFQEAREALEKYTKDTNFEPLFSEVKKDFKLVKEMLDQPFQKSQGDIYLKKIMKLRTASHQVVLALQKKSGKKSAEVINRMGRLRAVSQKINAIYLLKTMEVSSSLVEKNMQAAMKTFKDSLEFLTKIELMDAEMQKKLHKLTKIYRFFQVMNGSDNYVPTIISKKSDKMLKYADELTRSYIDQKK